MEVELSVTDVRNIQDKLLRVAEKLKDGSLITNVALKVERRAIMNAGGGMGVHAGGFPNVQTGRLKSSIFIQVSPDKNEAIVGTNVFYAPYVEFGHLMRGNVWKSGIRYTFGGITATRMRMTRAYPFLKPALDETIASGEMEGVFGNFCTDIEREWMI